MPVRKVYIWYIFSSYKVHNVTMYSSSFKEFWLFLSLYNCGSNKSAYTE